MTLQEKLPDIKFFTPREAFIELGWEFTPSGYEGGENIKCCGEKVTIGGFIGTEYAYCEKCNKRIQDITGIHRTGNATAGMINFDDVDDIDAEPRKWYIR